MANIGGSFAPPLPPEKLESFKELAAKSEPQTRAYMEELIHMVEVFRETPASRQPGTPHPAGLGQVVMLEEDEIKRIDHVVPWPEEIELMSAVFNKLDPATDKPTRDAAYHLLWFARRLAKDREPITNDKL